MRVEVDIFSGRPSPFWTASPQEAEALTDRKAREHLQKVLGQLEALRWQLVGIELSLPEPLAERVRLQDLEDEMDAVTELRTVIHCVLEDAIRPAPPGSSGRSGERRRRFREAVSGGGAALPFSVSEPRKEAAHGHAPRRGAGWRGSVGSPKTRARRAADW
jgi:hypothetical protein